MRLGLGLRAGGRIGGATPRDPEPAFSSRVTQLRYRPTSGGSWTVVPGVARLVPDTDRVVHTVSLTGLTPDTAYEFEVPEYVTSAAYLTLQGDPTTTMTVHWHTYQPHPLGDYAPAFSSLKRKFRTFPATLPAEGIRLAQITDTHGRAGNVDTFQALANQQVQAFIHTGDVATGNGGADGPGTWYIYFDALNHAVDADGFMIPGAYTLGNHDILNGAGGTQWTGPGYGVKPDFDTHTRGDAEWYYSFFPQFPGLVGYGLFEFGDYAALWLIDPGISTTLEGAQTDWLANTLAAHAAVPHRLVGLHYPPWPAGRRSGGVNYTAYLRETMCPVWEPYQPLVMAGHDHVWAKTVRIKGGTLEAGADDPDGTVYLMSGSSGSSAQPGRNPRTKWWIDGDSRATSWAQLPFEELESNPEYREPHPDDDTTFPQEEVQNWALIELQSGERTVTSYDFTGGVIRSFSQQV